MTAVDVPAQNPARRCLKLHQWPVADQARWDDGTQTGDLFDEQFGYAAGLRAATLSKTIKSYGAWLDFLARRGELDPEMSPLARASPNRVRGWVREMWAAGNAASSVIGRITDLQRALKILQPREQSARLDKTVSKLAAHLRPHQRTRSILVPGSAVLFAWGLRLMEQASNLKITSLAPIAYRLFACRPIAYRNGLIIACLAARGRRLHAIASLQPSLTTLPLAWSSWLNS